MIKIPRLLPLVAVAIGGVLAINALAGARDLPGMFSGARAFAEDAMAKTDKPAKGGAKDKTADKAADKGDAGTKTNADAAKPADKPMQLAMGPLPPPSATPIGGRAGQQSCAPTDASIAKEAGLSPSQLQMLQSLQARRGQLDDQEKSQEMQLQLLAAAGAKLDARVAALTALKGDIQTLLGQADEKQKAEMGRMVKVYATMKPDQAAKQLTILDDSVRLPILASPDMSTRTLAAIMEKMQPADAKKLSEALAKRLDAQKIDAGRAALAAKTADAPAPAATPSATPASAKVADASKPAKKPAAKKKKPAAAPTDVTPPGGEVPDAASADKAKTG